MGRTADTPGVTMEMTWENLTKLFTWAAQHGSEHLNQELESSDGGWSASPGASQDICALYK